MRQKDYYQVLGVPRGASSEAIKRAYRRLVLKYHPDRNPDPQATERMKEINEAFAVLSDPVKRQKYDRYGHKGLEGYTVEDIFGGIDFDSIFAELGLRNIFSDIFRGFGFGGRSIFESFFSEDSFFGARTGVRQLARRKGADLQYDLEIELEDAFWGREKKITVTKNETCPACYGTGAEKGGLSICKECEGKGQIVYEQRSGWSLFRQITTCPKCRGQGKRITSSCKRCLGEGMVEVNKELVIRIPRGADTGHVVKVEGEGGPGEDGGAAGDLYVRLHIKDHPVFKRQGADLYLMKEIPFTQAILGGKVYGIPAPDGELWFEIPEGTQDGTVFKISGKGMPEFDEERGDLYVEIKINIPRCSTCEEKLLLASFERIRALRLDPLLLEQRRFGLLALPPAAAKEGYGK
ncbi:MAG: molecular chaperone DnaJ [Candidatus Methanosuratincola sp.]